MSKLDPMDIYVLNCGNPNSAEYKKAQSRLELSKLEELQRLNDCNDNCNDEEYVHPYTYGIHPVVDFFHKIGETFCNIVNFIANIFLVIIYLVMAGVGIFVLFALIFGGWM